jgi:predicted dehydrogenase
VEALKLTPQHGTPGWTSWKEGNFVTPWSGHKSLYSELPQVGNRFFFDEEVKEFIAAVQGAPTDGGATALTAYQVAAVVAASVESSERGGTSVCVQVS